MDNKRLSQMHTRVCLTPEAACSLLLLPKAHTAFHARK